MIVFMQAGTNLAREASWSSKPNAKRSEPGKMWPGPPGRDNVHWKYRPFDRNGEGQVLFDSAKLGFQLNDNSFCQWFSIIAYLDDHGDPQASRALGTFNYGDYFNNYIKVVDFVQNSDDEQIATLRRDMVVLWNMQQFFNHTVRRSAQFHLSRSEIVRYFNQCQLQKLQVKGENYDYFKQDCFFDRVRDGVSEYISDYFQGRSRSRSFSTRSRSRSRD